ncbi:PhzF family phenazine biosynthesis protein [Streptomyces cocklensis]|uniref:Trans-2,3-dihydro-3-hydroxyanthranilate isomerase n=1 Tax=Actinacidiphila cocklensis TaxID=887465 RepID=A0A9W4GSC3_9ACTN|nr:PhzF family phenazine biosynthesis protein [Actinacidiphila cocklensis]MDD1057090.1 PhzF family phenazine biosynthesis protein [Actinacidiphila cocklensis]WSX78256.1 PhzF family phenazine biosynthesis protein [Streptomyces sp. NBC_00899]CAG6395179.1 Trans-2,3-dihydro-3-hydroxyanthranilate isomerase [Actinacidiphila cocklensis]
MGMREPDVTMVHACRRDGRGGSPTAVLAEAGQSDEERTAVARRSGASHAVFVAEDGDGAALRFFTAEGELPACGHGTVAALAHLAERARGRGATGAYEVALRVGGRAFDGRAVRDGGAYLAEFRTGQVELRAATQDEAGLVRAAFRRTPAGGFLEGAQVASLGRPRLLLPVAGRDVLRGLDPDQRSLREVCDRLGLLGCYVHTPAGPGGRLAARMFAPSIGVPEDIANANSTACLAAWLAGRGVPGVTAEMGDSLGVPSAVTATAGPDLSVRVGGWATVG